MSQPGKVIDLAEARFAREPHIVGEAHCVGCGHDFITVMHAAAFYAHVGGLECSRCGRMLVQVAVIPA